MIHNALKYGIDLSRAYTRFLGLGEDEDGVVRASETLTPIVDVWGTHHPECARLRGELRAARNVASAAVAGELSMVAAVLPASASNYIAIIEELYITTTAATSVRLDCNTEAAVDATLATLSRGAPCDSRDGTNRTASQLELLSGTDASVIGTALELIQVTTIDTVSLRSPPLVLSPGFAFIVTNNTVNQTLNVGFIWHERRARPGELA